MKNIKKWLKKFHEKYSTKNIYFELKAKLKQMKKLIQKQCNSPLKRDHT